MKYDLSILDKLMFPDPLVMFGAEISGHKFVPTKAIGLWVGHSIQTLKYILHHSSRIPIFSSVPSNRMTVLYMFRIAFEKLEVFKAIISSIKINVVYRFFRLKLSAEMLFHNISMLQNTLTINIYPHITKLRNRRLVVLIIRRSLRNIIATISMPSASVHLANPSSRCIKDSSTILNSAYFSFSHNNIITCGVN